MYSLNWRTLEEEAELVAWLEQNPELIYDYQVYNKIHELAEKSIPSEIMGNTEGIPDLSDVMDEHLNRLWATFDSVRNT